MRARLVSLVLCVLALFAPASAADRRGGPSLDRVLPQIRQTVPGTFYDAEGPFLSPDGQATYRIKWMTPDGRIVWFLVDARSGQVLGGAPYTASPSYRRDEDYRPPPREDFRRDEPPPRYGNQDNGWNRQHRNDDDDNQRYGRGQRGDQDNSGRGHGRGRRPNG